MLPTRAKMDRHGLNHQCGRTLRDHALVAKDTIRGAVQRDGPMAPALLLCTRGAGSSSSHDAPCPTPDPRFCHGRD